MKNSPVVSSCCRRLIGLFAVGLLCTALFTGCGPGEEQSNQETNQNQNQTNQNQTNQNQDETNQNQNQSNEYSDLEGIEVFEQVVSDGFCEAIWSCYGDTRTVVQLAGFLGGRYESLEECKEEGIELVGMTAASELEAAIDADRLVINTDAAPDCRDAIKDGLCGGSGIEAMPDACAQTFQGQVDEGGSCVEELECSGTMECDIATDDDQCYGTCQTSESSDCGGETCGDDEYCQSTPDSSSCEPLGGVDDACQSGSECEDELVCSMDDTCQPIEVVGEGEECGFYSNPYCEPGLACDGAGMEGGTCVTLGKQDDECFSTGACHSDFYCDMSDAGADEPGSCQPTKAIGETCEHSTECQSGNCDSEPGQAGECAESGSDEMCIHPDDR